jgi:hypothetical protein
MKRAKILLAAIAVLAVAGGVYASQVRQNTLVFTHFPTDPATKCTVPLLKYTTTPSGPAVVLATIDPALECALIRITTTD